MKKIKFFTLPIIVAVFFSSALLIKMPDNNKIILNVDQAKDTISRFIYGHFSEHLGHCIYGGIYVGENSKIPNTRGIRNDVVEALKKIKIPVLRWPGGCFADEYHWMDGIGPKEKRPRMVNTHWGGVVENNSFGTHEFMDLCEQLGCEPYICGNLGSGTVEEMSKWVEYLTFDGESPMANLRRQNGREKPWKVRFWGVGNENWGCGGNMTAEFYADQYRRYATYCRDYGHNRLYKIAGGPSGDDYHWMEVLMKNIPKNLVNGISLHYYTVPRNWRDKGSATQFDEGEYFTTIRKTLYMDELVTRHSKIMDQYDPAKRIGLIVDEWGTWYNVEPGTNPGFLFQQNTLRDAIVAAINLNIFNNHCDRVKMANIAQLVNVLQAMILTKDEKMIVTPSYHVFEMYTVHHDAALIPINISSEDYTYNNEKIPALNASASIDKNGKVNVSIAHINPNKNTTVTIEIRGKKVSKIVSARILTSAKINDHNTFDNPEVVKPADFKGYTLKDNILTVNMPSKSVVVLSME